MCGRFTLRLPATVLMKEFQADLNFDIRPRYNVSPGQTILALRGADKPEFVQLKWGLIPSWAKDPKIAFQCLNARSETVATKPAFRSAYKSRRCLIPADGYYEWLKQGKEKLPYLYEFDGGKPITFAGLWETWRDPSLADAPPIQTCTMLTTEPNPLAAEVHDRMPMIVHPEDRHVWLAGEQIPLVPYPTDGMTARRVSTHVNNSRHEGEECINSA